MGSRDIEVARRGRGRLDRSIAALLIVAAVNSGSAAAAPITSTSEPIAPPPDRGHGVIDRLGEHGAIDRIVDQQLAVVLLERQGLELVVPIAWLPPSATEGSWLEASLALGPRPSLRVDHQRTRQIRAHVEERQRALLDERGRRFPADRDEDLAD